MASFRCFGNFLPDVMSKYGQHDETNQAKDTLLLQCVLKSSKSTVILYALKCPYMHSI